MSSFLQDADSSYAIESATTSHISTHKKGKKSSLIWAHTREPLEHEDQELLYCSYCELDDKLYSAKTTSSMTKHIYSLYKIVIIEKGLSKNQEVVRQQLKSIYR